MEKEMKIPSQLVAPPSKEVIAVAKSQLGFMNMVAIPLFEGVADVMPGMEYCVNELQQNQAAWGERIEVEQAKSLSGKESQMDGMLSPRSMSMATSDLGSATNSYDANNLLNMVISSDKRMFVPDESAGLGNYHSMPEISKSEFIGGFPSSSKSMGCAQVGSWDMVVSQTVTQ
jgi:3',5'-cyclic-nucleotide phosphodiesterase